MSAPSATDWARDAVAELLRQTAVKLAARRERERVEAELWLVRLRREAAERMEREEAARAASEAQASGTTRPLQ